MTKAQRDTNLRNQILAVLRTALTEHYDVDLLQGDSNMLIMPCLDEEQNETWATITVSIPRGERDGNGGYLPYDAEGIAADYADKVQRKAEKDAEIARKKAEKEKKKKKTTEEETA